MDFKVLLGAHVSCQIIPSPGCRVMWCPMEECLISSRTLIVNLMGSLAQKHQGLFWFLPQVPNTVWICYRQRELVPPRENLLLLKAPLSSRFEGYPINAFGAQYPNVNAFTKIWRGLPCFVYNRVERMGTSRICVSLVGRGMLTPKNLVEWALFSQDLCPQSSIDVLGSSVVFQWLGLGTFTAVAQVQSLVGQLRSCKPLQASWYGQKKKSIGVLPKHAGFLPLPVL